MLILPRLDRVLVQDAPNAATADLLAERLAGAFRQIRDRLPTDREFRLGDNFTGHGAPRQRSPEGEKIGLRPRPFSSSIEKSPAAQRRRQRWTWRADKPTMRAASSWRMSGCSCTSNTKRKRCTSHTAAVRRRTSSRPACTKSSGKVQGFGWGPRTSGFLSKSGLRFQFPPIPEVRRNHDVICETDHLVSASCDSGTSFFSGWG